MRSIDQYLKMMMKLNIKPKINDISYSNNKDIRKAKKNCKRKLNRPKMRLHFGRYILKGHLSTRPDLCGFCGSGS